MEFTGLKDMIVSCKVEVVCFVWGLDGSGTSDMVLEGDEGHNWEEEERENFIGGTRGRHL